jgi:hypothetical protein
LQPLFGEDGWPEAGGWGGVDNGESWRWLMMDKKIDRWPKS